MLGRLTRKDYETILNHYDVSFKRNSKLTDIKSKAEDILTTKLCKCIKQVSKSSKTEGEKRSIPVCKKSVLHRKGLTDSGFSCKQKSIKLRRLGRNTVVTTRRTIRKRND